MKELNLKITTCLDCPFCKNDKELYGFVCEKTNNFICSSITEPAIPDFCPLQNIQISNYGK